MAVADCADTLEIVQLRDTDSLAFITPGFWVGYFLPIVLVVWPLDNATNQFFVALWQGFPLWILLVHYLLERLSRGSRRFSVSEQVELFNQEKDLIAAYDFAFYSASYGQATIYVYFLFCNFLPWIWPRAGSDLFAIPTFRQVFLPGPFYSRRGMTSIPDAVHDFLIYSQYVGTTAVLITAAALYMHHGHGLSRRKRSEAILEVLGKLIRAGPTGLLVWALELCDVRVLRNAGYAKLQNVLEYNGGTLQEPRRELE